MAEIKDDVRRMQARGYYGDGALPNLSYLVTMEGPSQILANVVLCTGFWSDGRRLKDSAKMGAESLRASATTVS